MEVFDFTSSDFDLISYEHFSAKQRKSYQVGSESDGKIIVTLTNVDDVIAECIYRFLTKEEIYKMIVADQSLQLKGIYVKDFDITEIVNYKQHELKDFDARFSFWDGKVSFRKAKFADGNVLFEKSSFGNGFLSFGEAVFGKGEVIFESAEFGNGDVLFNLAKFGDGNVSFRGVKLGKGDMLFTAAKFGTGSVTFCGSEFGKGDVLFESAEF